MTVKLSDRKVVVSAGTAVPLPTRAETEGGQIFYIQALLSNTGTVYIGDDGTGDVSPTTGYPMTQGAQMQLTTPDLSIYFMDADNSGDGISWLKVGGN